MLVVYHGITSGEWDEDEAEFNRKDIKSNNGRKEEPSTKFSEKHGLVWGESGRWRDVSFSDDSGRIRLFSEVVRGGEKELKKINNFVAYNAYTSTSAKADGHPVPDGTKYGVTLEIECESGRDLDGFGNNFESEVLYPRGFSFVVTEVSTDSNGRPYIKVKEIGEDVRHSRNSEEHGNVLQQMRAESSIHGDLPQISE